jgi:hypothetical protein
MGKRAGMGGIGVLVHERMGVGQSKAGALIELR